MTTQHDTPDELSDFTQLLAEEEEFPGRPQVDPTIRRRRRRRGWIAALVVIAVMVGVPASYVAWALNAPLSAPSARDIIPGRPSIQWSSRARSPQRAECCVFAPSATGAGTLHHC